MVKGTTSDYDEMNGPGHAATASRVFGCATRACLTVADSRRAFPVALA